VQIMTDDLVAELSKLQRYAASLHSLVEDAQARAPEKAEGSDRSGAVSVTLGRDGLPVSIRVSPDWNRRIRPAALGDAVVAASRAAEGERMAAWTRALERDGWRAKADRLRASGYVPPSGPAAGEVPAAFRRERATVTPRPLGVVAEDALSAFEAAERFRPPSPTSVRGAGQAAAGRLTITLSAGGLLSCAADPRWVSGQVAATLASALGQALAQARAALAESAAAASKATTANPARRLTGLFDEAIALLADPRRLRES
jgi:hypothetical protein